MICRPKTLKFRVSGPHGQTLRLLAESDAHRRRAGGGRQAELDDARAVTRESVGWPWVVDCPGRARIHGMAWEYSPLPSAEWGVGILPTPEGDRPLRGFLRGKIRLKNSLSARERQDSSQSPNTCQVSSLVPRPHRRLGSRPRQWDPGDPGLQGSPSGSGHYPCT